MTIAPDGPPPFSAELTLAQAAKKYLERRKSHLKSRSFEAYCYHFRTLEAFYGPEKRLSSFHEEHMRDYQKWRAQSGRGRGKAGASLINHELGALAQLLALADLWHPISKYYERLPEPAWTPPRVLTPAEEDRFLRWAARKPEWRTALNSTLVTANSTIFGCELRTLRMEHLRLDLDPPLIRIPVTVKNRFRVRSVPLNDIALNAVRDLIAQAKERGSVEPHHYLIPFRIKNGLYDPNFPASPFFIRTSFRSIARSCGLGWVTPRCFRHQAITKLLESGAPDETVRSIAGHNSEKAIRYYSHIRIEAKRDAVALLTPSRAKANPARTRKTGGLPLLAELKETAKRLGIPADAAVELVLEYERSKARAG
jgi:integrase